MKAELKFPFWGVVLLLTLKLPPYKRSVYVPHKETSNDVVATLCVRWVDG